MIRLVLLLVGLVFVAPLSGCSSRSAARSGRVPDYVSALAEIKRLSPRREFDENIRRQKIVLFGIGNTTHGYRAPGLTEEEVSMYIESQRLEVVIRFSDDPQPLGASEEYWAEAERFVTAYNKMMLEYVKRIGVHAGQDDSLKR